MTFICIGGSLVPDPLAAFQLMRICSFVDEHFLSISTLLIRYSSKFPQYQNLKLIDQFAATNTSNDFCGCIN